MLFAAQYFAPQFFHQALHPIRSDKQVQAVGVDDNAFDEQGYDQLLFVGEELVLPN
jgi:hypothetical protein